MMPLVLISLFLLFLPLAHIGTSFKDSSLDKARGSKSKRNISLQSTPPVMQSKNQSTPTADIPQATTMTARNILRPQLRFEDRIDNSNSTPFQRKLVFKDNAKRPLDFSMPSSGELSLDMVSHIKSLGITDVNSSAFQLSCLLCLFFFSRGFSD